MARENFKHGKRLRELAKKQKKQEKLQRKLERHNNPSAAEPDGDVPVEPEPAETSEEAVP